MPPAVGAVLRTIFEDAKDENNKKRCVNSFKLQYGKMDKIQFRDEFLRLLLYPMSIFERCMDVDNVLEVAKEFAVTLPSPSDPNPSTADSETGGESMNPFLLGLLEFCVHMSGTPDKAVRLRSCQMLTKMLKSLPVEAEMSEELFTRILSKLIDRARDVVPRVRLHGVNALARLQNPNDRNDAVVASK